MTDLDFLFAWIVVVTAICFGAKLLHGNGEQRFGRGLFHAQREGERVAVTPRRRIPDRRTGSAASGYTRAGYRPRASR